MPEASPLSPLADYLDQQRGKITSTWMERVRADRKIPSADDLPREELLDHLPSLLHSLIDQLRGATLDRSAVTLDSETHGRVRFRQNYELDEVLREIGVLRRILVDCLIDFHAKNASVPNIQYLSVAVINDALDAVIRHSTTGFVTRQQKEIQEANDALGKLNAQIQGFNNQLVDLDERRLRTLRTITHEIANHLNAMGLVITLVQRAKDPTVVESHTKSLAGGVTAMTALLKQLLEFATLASAGESLNLKPFEAHVLFGEISTVVKALATQKGLTYKEHLDPVLTTITTDHDKLRRICLNLATNAVKYTAVGSVTFSFRSHPDGRWCVEVADTGCGIAAEDHERIFDEFYRTGTTGTEPGVGLGLAITKHLTHMLGGEIEVESKPGNGAIFRVFLPAS